VENHILYHWAQGLSLKLQNYIFMILIELLCKVSLIFLTITELSGATNSAVQILTIDGYLTPKALKLPFPTVTVPLPQLVLPNANDAKDKPQQVKYMLRSTRPELEPDDIDEEERKHMKEQDERFYNSSQSDVQKPKRIIKSPAQLELERIQLESTSY
jgi:hypothetical protein